MIVWKLTWRDIRSWKLRILPKLLKLVTFNIGKSFSVEVVRGRERKERAAICRILTKQSEMVNRENDLFQNKPYYVSLFMFNYLVSLIYSGSH